MAKFTSSGPTPDLQPSLTDIYFKHTREIVKVNGDCEVTYAVFMRRPVTFAGRLAIDWITSMAAARQAKLKIEQLYVEGAWIGAGEPICYITGPFSVLVDLETIFLQRLGSACVAAYNAYNMCIELPKVASVIKCKEVENKAIVIKATADKYFPITMSLSLIGRVLIISIVPIPFSLDIRPMETAGMKKR